MIGIYKIKGSLGRGETNGSYGVSGRVERFSSFTPSYGVNGDDTTNSGI